MAVDSEARSSGNSAIVIALVAIVLVVAGAFAFLNNRPTETVAVPTEGSTTVVNNPAPAAPDVHVDVPASPPVVVSGGSSGSSGSSGSASSGSSSTTTTTTETKSN